ncbi:MAG: SIP domain-containing protein [Gammaproteobacteria bacterium]|nr:SIP domain-containing protein [Gammaproteobacteria bacterium]
MIKSPLADQDEKFDIIEHINQDHTDEILSIAHVFTDYTNANTAKLLDIFEEGAELELTFYENLSEVQSVFVPFQIKGDIEEKLLYLAYSAMAQQGKALSDSKRQFFEITDTYLLTPNIIRLTISSDSQLPEKSPAYAYGFLLKVIEKQKIQKETINVDRKKTRFQHLADTLLLWVMKKLSSKNRKKMIKGMNKGIRYYTLQTSWRSGNNDFCDQGFVDVFFHGETKGSQWALSLKKGDVISSRVESADNHDNINDGQALLIADETAYPALLGILQEWQNPIAPFVIIISEKPEEQHYFSDEDISIAARVLRITCPPCEQGKHVTDAIESLPEFCTTWGAFEKESSKTVRAYIRNHYDISGHNNRIRGYWVL